MSAQTEAGASSLLLITKLQASGILDGHDSTEILTAFIGVAAEAIHRDRHLSPVGCLQVIVATAQKMMKHEKMTNMLREIFGRSQWRVGS